MTRTVGRLAARQASREAPAWRYASVGAARDRASSAPRFRPCQTLGRGALDAIRAPSCRRIRPASLRQPEPLTWSAAMGRSAVAEVTRVDSSQRAAAAAASDPASGTAPADHIGLPDCPVTLTGLSSLAEYLSGRQAQCRRARGWPKNRRIVGKKIGPDGQRAVQRQLGSVDQPDSACCSMTIMGSWLPMMFPAETPHPARGPGSRGWRSSMSGRDIDGEVPACARFLNGPQWLPLHSQPLEDPIDSADHRPGRSARSTDTVADNASSGPVYVLGD